MLTSDISGAAASTVLPADSLMPSPSPHHETVRHMLFGSPSGVQTNIWQLHRQSYAEPND